MTERRQPKPQKELFKSPRGIEEFCVYPVVGEGNILDTIMLGDLAFNSAILPDSTDPFIDIEEYAQYRKFIQEIELANQNREFAISSLHIKKSDLRAFGQKVIPDVIEQQYTRTVRSDSNNSTVAGLVDYQYFYFHRGSTHDNLTQKVSIKNIPRFINPLIKGVFVERIVHESFGDLTYGHVLLHNQQIPEKLGISAPDGDLLSLTFASDRVLLTSSSNPEVHGQVPYEMLADAGIRARFVNDQGKAVLALGAGHHSFQLILGKVLKPHYAYKLFNPEIELITNSSVNIDIYPQAALN